MSWSPPPVTELSREHLAFLRGVDSPTIANAIERFSVRDRCEGFLGGRIGCFFPELGPMVGHALTVTMTNAPGEIAGRDGYWKMWEALERMPRPSVLVTQDVSGEPNRCAYCGEVMATMARKLGAVGIVTDGGVRDVDEVRALGVHYFAPFPVVSHGNFSVVEVGQPISLDGQEVRTGDILHGDANGIVIVPGEIVADLPEAVDAIRTRERQMMEYVNGTTFTVAGAKEMTGY
jgi:4-hydroxy-4-methyl-2-oxoglutarate aldolase